MSASRLIDRLEGVRATGPGRWIAKCPAHEDRSPSLNVREVEDGTVLVKCFAGCGASDVVGAVGLEFRDLFPERPAEIRRKSSRAWMDARDVVAAIATDCEILAIAASDITEGRPISKDDADRIARAAGRIRDAWSRYRGH